MNCKVEDCGNLTYLKDYCTGHYLKTRKYGTPIPPSHIRKYTKHDGTYSPEYIIWNAMKQRCSNKKTDCYMNYGGRGIEVCERWMQSFDNFLIDMGNRPSKNHSIDRVDVNGDYEPSNCRWATRTEQNRNIRVSSSSRSGVKGVTWDKRCNKWEASITVAHVKKFLGRFLDMNEAISARKKAETLYW